MYERGDLVDAHVFIRGRLSASTIRSDPDAMNLPLRRTSVGLIWGLAIVGLVTIVIVVLQLFFFRGTDKANTTWMQAGSTMIVTEETGSRYLLADGVLHPVFNRASAAITLGEPPRTTKVSEKEIQEVPRGTPVGVPGWPDALPSAQGMPLMWSACAASTEVAVTVGTTRNTLPLHDEQGVLVVTDDDAMFLLWRGKKLAVADDVTARAVGLNPGEARRVPPMWLNTIPKGPDLGAIALEPGQPGPEIDGSATVAGQLIMGVEDARETAYVVTSGGLVPLTPFAQTMVELAYGDKVPQARSISRGAMASTPVLTPPPSISQVPADHLSRVVADGMLCSTWVEGETSIGISPQTDPDEAGPAVTFNSKDGKTASFVTIDVPNGVMARTAPSPASAGVGAYLIGEDGRKYPVTDDETATALGVPLDDAVRAPQSVLSMIPSGAPISGAKTE